ncbi:oligosaccharide flippase family protein [Clostridium sp. D53t1_180928_C8]|uniref:oligosaccharide flippase family protein n=1 Tax=Clostridium sp. D53t1_180928_C8 TaxID=2787101 RepID=UPI0018AC7D8A|nr:oligosaccharide flippase family protein [Clostridium sp. D53t1_180928_C8]
MSIIKNYLYNTVYQIMSMLIPLITMPYLTRVFDPEQLGLNSLSLSIANYFMLFGVLGMQMYGNRQIAYVRDNKEKLAKTFWSLYTVQLATSTVSLIAYYVFISCFTTVNTTIYLIQGLNIISVMIDISWLFMGLEDFKKVVIRNTFARLVGLACIFIFIKSPDDLLLYALLTVLVNIVSILLMWLYVPRYVGSIVIDKKIVRRTIKPLLKLFLPQIATQVYTLLARTLVGFLSTKDQVIFYDYSQRIVNMVLAMITSIGVVLLPRVSNIIGNGKREEVPRIIEKTFKIVSYLAIPMSIGLMCVSKILVSWFLSPKYLSVGQLTAWTSLIIIAVSWANIIGVQYLIATKQENKYTLSIIIAAIVNLIMNLCLIPSHGAAGAIISLIVAEYIGIVIQLILVRKQLPIKRMLLGVVKYVIVSLIMGVFVVFIGNSISNGMLANIVQGISGVVIYIVIMFIIKDEVQKEMISRIMTMIKKK